MIVIRSRLSLRRMDPLSVVFLALVLSSSAPAHADESRGFMLPLRVRPSPLDELTADGRPAPAAIAVPRSHAQGRALRVWVGDTPFDVRDVRFDSLGIDFVAEPRTDRRWGGELATPRISWATIHGRGPGPVHDPRQRHARSPRNLLPERGAGEQRAAHDSGGVEQLGSDQAALPVTGKRSLILRVRGAGRRCRTLALQAMKKVALKSPGAGAAAFHRESARSDRLLPSRAAPPWCTRTPIPASGKVLWAPGG